MRRIVLFSVALLLVINVYGDAKEKPTSIFEKYTSEKEFIILEKLFDGFDLKLKQHYKTDDLDFAIRLYLKNFMLFDKSFYTNKSTIQLLVGYRKDISFLKNWNKIEVVRQSPEYKDILEKQNERNSQDTFKSEIVEVLPVTADVDYFDENVAIINEEDTSRNFILNPFGKLFRCLEIYSNNLTLKLILLNFRELLDLSPDIISVALNMVVEEEHPITEATKMSVFLLCYVQMAINSTN